MVLIVFFLLVLRQPRSTLFPYTTLFRSRSFHGSSRSRGAGKTKGRRRRPCGRFAGGPADLATSRDRKSTRLNSSHSQISYAVFCLKKKNTGRQKGRATLAMGAVPHDRRR